MRLYGERSRGGRARWGDRRHGKVRVLGDTLAIEVQYIGKKTKVLKNLFTVVLRTPHSQANDGFYGILEILGRFQKMLSNNMF
jgi:hypothetical protein